MISATATNPSTTSAEERTLRLIALIAVFLVLGVRLAHLASAVKSPFTYHPGPDEDFYLRFGKAVAGLTQGDAVEFAFMDPAYGYVLGAIFKAVGPNVFVVYLIQILLDTVTAIGIFLIGREFGRSRGGLYGAILYALTCTAVLYSSTILKATWVANFMVLWVLFGLLLLRTNRLVPWVLFGLFCGYGIALRSNMALMAAIAAVLLPWLYHRESSHTGPDAIRRVLLLLLGLALPLSLLAIRNNAISQKFSPLPNNGGIVLHQLYNVDNPRALNWTPPFAAHAHPSDIWRGYLGEATKRTGRPLTPAEVERYWRSQALAYIASHPAGVMRNMLLKASLFVAYVEIPNNRSLADERMFSPVLRILPSPFAWLFALGLPGLVLLLYRDRRGLLLIAPVLAVIATMAVFFAEARFRLHAVPMFALGAGLLVDDVVQWVRARQIKRIGVAAAVSGLLALSSLVLGNYVQRPATAWDRIVWGYINMGDIDSAKTIASRIVREQPANSAVHEALGFIAASQKDHQAAVEHYRRALALRPGSHVAHYNLARALTKSGKHAEAMEHALAAQRIAPLPEYGRLIEVLRAK